MSKFSHISVLLDEAIDGLNIVKGGKYVDATVGGGGHTKEILKRGGTVLGMDRDDEAIVHIKERFEKEINEGSAIIVKANFKEIGKVAVEKGFGKVNGVLFDLGVSSHQLDSTDRGFSIKNESRLDMRMDKKSQLSAYDVVNKYPYERLVEIFIKFGEEHNAKKIAELIVEKRKQKAIITTIELAELVEKVSHKSEPIHPATRVFQAIRIEVNDEIEALKNGINSSMELLLPGGRIEVISFHSLEDRVIKLMFDKFRKNNLGQIITRSPLTATISERSTNRRARSAKLRIFEKI